MSWTQVAAPQWDEALPLMNGAAFFDQSRWTEAFAWKCDRVFYLHFLEKGRPVAGLCLGSAAAAPLNTLKSPFSASCGGLLFAPDLAASIMLSAAGGLKAFLLDLVGPFKLTLTQRGRLAAPGHNHDAIEFALKYSGFAESDILYEIALDAGRDVCLAPRARSILHKIEREKKLVFESCGAEDFLRLRRRAAAEQGKTITVPDEEIRRGHELFPQNIRFWKVSSDGRPLAVLLSDRLNRHICVGRNWFMDNAHRQSNATLFLLCSWHNWVQSEGLPWAGLGATLQQSSPRTNNTLQFKERFLNSRSDIRRVFTLEGLRED